MRGLKLLQASIKFNTHVASFTDAWIETDNAIKLSGLEVVASFTDAWIETQYKERNSCSAVSHLLQMRGLKRQSG